MLKSIGRSPVAPKIPTLRWYQDHMVNGIRAEFRDGIDAVLAVAPTDAGKTIMFSFISRGAALRGNRVCIITHRQELLQQISCALDQFHVPHGMIQAGFEPKSHELVQVASVQSLAKYVKSHQAHCLFDLVIMADAYFLADDTWNKVWTALGRPPVLGFTASPARTDGRDLGKVASGIFTSMVEVVGTAELIAEGYLTSSFVFAPPIGVDVSGIMMRGGDYDRDELSRRFDQPEITGDAVDHYRKLCDGATTVAFGVDLTHCGHIAGQFCESGYRFKTIDGSMDDNQRRRLISGLGVEHQGLVSCDLIGEGLEIPPFVCEIVLRKTASLAVHVQQTDKALTPIYADGHDLGSIEGRLGAIAASSKPAAVIIDHVGNALVHGLPDAPRAWSLEGARLKGGRRLSTALDIQTCGACHAVALIGPVCRHCGATVETYAEAYATLQHHLRKERRIEVTRATTLTELQAIGRAEGYKPGWAEAVFTARGNRPAAPGIAAQGGI